MEYGAIDLHKKESQVRIVTEAGEVLDRRIPTTRNRFTAMFCGRSHMRILLEASTESEWVAQHLETFGHEVVVADPNYTPMYGHRSRRVKTDRRDVAALTEACQRGIYRVVHRRSARQQAVQSQLNVRQELVQARTRAISLARAITRAAGLRVRSGRTETFLTRLDALDLPAPTRIVI
jgi:transposase